MAAVRKLDTPKLHALAVFGLCTALVSPVFAQGDVAARVYRKASNSVVTVEVIDRTGKKLQGSGVVIKSEKGGGSLIVTNAHVVSTASTIRLIHKKSTLPAKLWYAFAENITDLAFLEVDQLLEIAAIQTMDVETGSAVFAIGSPLGLQASISAGIVAGKREGYAGIPLIQTTAAISPGSSGGGLFNADAKLIGITSFKIARGDGINFAIDASVIPFLVIAVGSAKSFQEAILTNRFVEVGTTTAQTLRSDNFVMWLGAEIVKTQFELAKIISIGAGLARSKNSEDSAGTKQKFQGIFSGLTRSWEMSEAYKLELRLRGLDKPSESKG